MTRTTSAAGRAALMAREGCRLEAYLDSVGVPTIGVGHAATAPTPPAVRMGMTITREQADEILSRDLAVFEAAVNAADIKGRLSQNAYDASVSLAFNIGRGAFAKSTVARLIASGDMQGAADAILMWNKPAVLEGRRKAERAQFLTPDATPELDAIRDAINAAAKDQAVAHVAVPAPKAVSVSAPTAGPQRMDKISRPTGVAGIKAWWAYLISKGKK